MRVAVVAEMPSTATSGRRGLGHVGALALVKSGGPVGTAGLQAGRPWGRSVSALSLVLGRAATHLDG